MTDLAERSRLYWSQCAERGELTADTVRQKLGGHGDPRRLLQMAVCICDHPAPTLTSISRATGQNKGIIDSNIERLKTLGFEIEKKGSLYGMTRWSPIFNQDALRTFILELCA